MKIRKPKYIIQQRFSGTILLLLSAIVIVMAMINYPTNSHNPLDTDITPVVFLIPLGLYLVITKQKVLINIQN